MVETRKTSSFSALLTPLYAAILPFTLWPIEYFFPYPHVVEELAKALLVTGLNKHKAAYLIAVCSGLVFAISESVLYMMNIVATQHISTLGVRLLLTIPLHAGTTLIMLAFYRFEKNYLTAGVVIAIAIHYLFNLYVVRINPA